MVQTKGIPFLWAWNSLVKYGIAVLSHIDPKPGDSGLLELAFFYDHKSQTSLALMFGCRSASTLVVFRLHDST